jgi:hypothetical protein
MLVYFTDILSIFRPLDMCYVFCGNLVYFPRFGILQQEKSGNRAAGDDPGLNHAMW